MVCLQLYDEGEHTPRVLSCGHSVCHSCIADLRSHWGAGGTEGKAGHAGGGLVRCPECKQHTKIPLGGVMELPKNIELMRLIQTASNGEISGKSGKLDAKELKKALVKKEQSPPSSQDSTTPCLLSEFVYGEPVIWILPQMAIKRRKEIMDGVCVGDFLCDKKLQSVSMEYLSKIGIHEGSGSRGLKYKELVCLAWNSLHHEVRGKLMRLLALSCRCNYFAEVAGLWMSEEGVLFLVSKVYIEGIKQARCLFFPATDGRKSPGHYGLEGESSSSGSPQEDVVGRDSVKTLIRLGLELCEMLLEIHAAGILVGILGLDAFALDPYGHLRLLIGNSVCWRRFVGDSSLCSKLKSCISSLGVGIFNLEEIEKAHNSSTNALGSSYECLSPEVSEIIKKLEDADITTSSSSPVAGSSCGSADEALVTQKADVWSLGYVLLQLLSQQEILEQNERFKGLLLNCMASVPSNRPRVVDIWWELKGLLEDRALGIPSHLIEDSLKDKLDLEICESGSKIGKSPGVNFSTEPEIASEARADALQDLQTSTVEATMDAPSLSRALIDVEQCNSEVKILRGHMDTLSCLSVCGTTISHLWKIYSFCEILVGRIGLNLVSNFRSIHLVFLLSGSYMLSPCELH